VAKLEVDITRIEIEHNRPHWLSPSQRYASKLREIRAKHRAKWLAEREEKRQCLK
jgi:hypothetical protein